MLFCTFQLKLNARNEKIGVLFVLRFEASKKLKFLFSLELRILANEDLISINFFLFFIISRDFIMTLTRRGGISLNYCWTKSNSTAMIPSSRIVTVNASTTSVISKNIEKTVLVCFVIEYFLFHFYNLVLRKLSFIIPT